jgi:hypothetical protein
MPETPASIELPLTVAIGNDGHRLRHEARTETLNARPQ